MIRRERRCPRNSHPPLPPCPPPSSSLGSQLRVLRSTEGTTLGVHTVLLPGNKMRSSHKSHHKAIPDSHCMKRKRARTQCQQAGDQRSILCLPVSADRSTRLDSARRGSDQIRSDPTRPDPILASQPKGVVTGPAMMMIVTTTIYTIYSAHPT